MLDSVDIARALEEIAVLLALSGENAFKVRAYERGARIVLDLGEQLAERIEDGTLTEIEGIGEKLGLQIEELARSGRSIYLEQLRQAHPPGAVELARVPGMTLRRLRALHEGLGIGSVEDLRAACLAQRVRTLPGFGPKTEARLLQAIERAVAPAEPRRLLLTDARSLSERIANVLLTGGATRALVAGEVRRCEEVISQLDLVVVARDQNTETVWQRVLRTPWATRIDRASSSVQLSQGITLRLHFAEEARLGLALLLATGPHDHVAALRERARTRGRTLESLAEPGADEASSYRALGLEPVPPELRGTRGDFDPRGYADLLRFEQIRGLVHCHTLYSDGRDSIEDMARAADALGMQYLTITDHSPSAHYARGVTLDRLREQWDEIARVQELVSVRILRGTESDILADGALDYPDDVLERFDVVIGSIHARHRMNGEQMTARLVRALGLPIFKIWGHALGRILLSREPIECDVPKVLDALASAPGAIEVNGDPHRIDLPPAWIPHARERGIPFVVSVDAHSTQGLGVLASGVDAARRGGLRSREVLNTLPADQFVARVRPVPRP